MNSEISSYTISVYELQQAGFDFGLDRTDTYVPYEIFDENYRPVLNKAILDYYMFREIGYTNPAVWRQRLITRLNILMRNKYNALYKAKMQEFNPLYTMELYETYSHEVENTGEQTANGTQKNTVHTNSTDENKNHANTQGTDKSDTLALSSQFPSEEMTANDLTDNLYVDSAQKNTSNETSNSTDDSSSQTNSISNENSNNESSNTNNNKNNTKESYSKKTIGSASDLTFAHAMTQFKEYCDKFNLDQLVIDDLKDLFMSKW